MKKAFKAALGVLGLFAVAATFGAPTVDAHNNPTAVQVYVSNYTDRQLIISSATGLNVQLGQKVPPRTSQWVTVNQATGYTIATYRVSDPATDDGCTYYFKTTHIQRLNGTWTDTYNTEAIKDARNGDTGLTCIGYSLTGAVGGS